MWEMEEEFLVFLMSFSGVRPVNIWDVANKIAVETYGDPEEVYWEILGLTEPLRFGSEVIIPPVIIEDMHDEATRRKDEKPKRTTKIVGSSQKK